jgi:hypothetical protein
MSESMCLNLFLIEDLKKKNTSHKAISPREKLAVCLRQRKNLSLYLLFEIMLNVHYGHTIINLGQVSMLAEMFKKNMYFLHLLLLKTKSSTIRY